LLVHFARLTGLFQKSVFYKLVKANPNLLCPLGSIYVYEYFLG
jgi:hypothetical protein